MKLSPREWIGTLSLSNASLTGFEGRAGGGAGVEGGASASAMMEETEDGRLASHSINLNRTRSHISNGGVVQARLCCSCAQIKNSS